MEVGISKLLFSDPPQLGLENKWTAVSSVITVTVAKATITELGKPLIAIFSLLTRLVIGATGIVGLSRVEKDST